MPEFLQQVQPFLTILQWIVVIAAAVFMILMRSLFAEKKEHNALEAKVVELEGRIGRMNERMTQVPTAQNLHDLQISVERLTGQIAVSNERMSGLEGLHGVMKRQIEVMDDFLRQRK
jgi:hypothetical protein